MALTLNSKAFDSALRLAHAGKISHGDWTAPEGAERTAENSIGHDADAEPSDQHKYPVTSGGMVSAKGVGSALAYAKKNSETAIIPSLEKLDEAIKANATPVELSRAAQLARCPNGSCGSHDITRTPGATAHEGPMDKCRRCGRTFAHKPGTVTADQHAASMEPETDIQPVAAEAVKTTPGNDVLLHRDNSTTTGERMPTVLSPEMRQNILDRMKNASDIAELSREGVEDEVLLSRLINAQAADSTAANAHAAEMESWGDLQAAEVARLTKALEAHETANLSRTEPQLPDPATLHLLSRSLQIEREAAITAGGIDEATAKGFDQLLSNADGTPSVIALSRAGDATEPLAFRFWELMRTNKPVTANGVPRTSAHINFARTTPGGSSADPEKAKAVQDRMQRVANGEIVSPLA